MEQNIIATMDIQRIAVATGSLTSGFNRKTLYGHLLQGNTNVRVDACFRLLNMLLNEQLCSGFLEGKKQNFSFFFFYVNLLSRPHAPHPYT